jgi:hypothetical protein
MHCSRIQRDQNEILTKPPFMMYFVFLKIYNGRYVQGNERNVGRRIEPPEISC